MRTQDTQNIHCCDYMHKIGAKFARSQNGTHGLEYVYHSPVRADHKPSLCVNIDRNIWSDVPADVGGRLIELVCYTNHLILSDVSSALKILDQLFPEYRGRGSSSGYFPRPQRYSNSAHVSQSAQMNVHKITDPAGEGVTPLKEKRNERKILRTRPIYRYPLKNYLADRKIDLSIAEKYLEEVDYRDEQGRTFYALGWKTGDSYSLRTKNFKGFLGKGVDISVFDTKSSEIYVFEGMFDYLSFLSHLKRPKLPLTAIVMNSVA